MIMLIDSNQFPGFYRTDHDPPLPATANRPAPCARFYSPSGIVYPVQYLFTLDHFYKKD
jgi:hypothetical protein